MKLFFWIKKIFKSITDYLKQKSLKRNLTILEEIKQTRRYIWWKNVPTVIRSEMTKKPGKVLSPDIMKLKFVILSVRNVMLYPSPNSTGFMRNHLTCELTVQNIWWTDITFQAKQPGPYGNLPWAGRAWKKHWHQICEKFKIENIMREEKDRAISFFDYTTYYQPPGKFLHNVLSFLNPNLPTWANQMQGPCEKANGYQTGSAKRNLSGKIIPTQITPDISAYPVV